MRLLKKMRRQWAVLWVISDDYNKDGSPAYSSAREIKVRWEDHLQEVVLPNGSKFVSKAMIYVGEDIPLRSVLWLGRVSQLTDITTPLNNTKSFEVVRFDSIPTKNAKDFLRICFA